MESVKIRGFQNGIAVGRDIAVSLIVREDENDVGFRGNLAADNRESGEQEQKQSFHGWESVGVLKPIIDDSG